ncbi:MAG: hypothetical protein Q8O40_15860 [Chloroflexota bacterium]|nr:hypothetical protein [Chloroflexota bacterium]
MGSRPGKGKWGVSRMSVFLGVLGLAMVGWMVPAIALAWLSWDGIDPVIALNGGQQNLAIRIDWPSKYTCSIQGPIDVRVSVPAGMDAKVVQESTDSFPCGNVISTVTSVSDRRGEKRSDQVGVAVMVNASDSFPAKVTVSLDGEVAQVLRGSSSSVIAGWVSVNGD